MGENTKNPFRINNFKESEHFKEPSALAPGISATEPKPADLIEISRGPYQHWGTYVGDGDVIHVVRSSENADVGVSRFNSVRHKEATVKKEPLQDVVGSDKYRIHNVLDKKYQPFPKSDIVQKAESLVGKVLPYSLFTFNCEHFATLLRYGKPQSQQVRKAVGIAAAVMAFVCAIICLVLYCKRKSKVYSVLGFLSLFLCLFTVIFLVIQWSNHR